MQLLIWVVVLAIPIALLTLLFLVVYEYGIEFYEGFSESFGISPAFFAIKVATIGGLSVGLDLLGYAIHLQLPFNPYRFASWECWLALVVVYNADAFCNRALAPVPWEPGTLTG